MARRGRRDRGLYSRPNAQGTVRWYVRIAVEGRMQTFAPHGGFPTKREATTFLDDLRTRIRHGTFFPEQFKTTPCPLAVLLDDEATRGSRQPNSKNNHAYRTWWRTFAGQLDARTLPTSLIDEARRALEGQDLSPQTIHHYLKYLRHLLNRGEARRIPRAQSV